VLVFLIYTTKSKWYILFSSTIYRTLYQVSHCPVTTFNPVFDELDLLDLELESRDKSRVVIAAEQSTEKGVK